MGDWHTNPVVWIGAIAALVIASMREIEGGFASGAQGTEPTFSGSRWLDSCSARPLRLPCAGMHGAPAGHASPVRRFQLHTA